MKRVGIAIGFITSVVIIMIMANIPARAAGVGAAGDPVKGKAVYATQKCNVCHKIGGVGGPMGPDLSTIGAKRDAAWLAKYLVNPTVLDPKNPPKMKMTPTKAKGQDLDDLVAYLLTLKK